MKRFKYRHRFNGRNYPLNAAFFIAVIYQPDG